MLRPYQTEILNKTRLAFKQGYKSPCIVAPCGAGKSVIVAEMAKCATDKGHTVLFLVHRRELCDQIFRTFSKWGCDMHNVYIGMVQTVCRRLGKFRKPDLIITDENHHCLAGSYRKIYEFYKDVPRVGVTATPIRLNGSGLGDVNDILIEGVSTRWLIDNAFLAPYDYYAPDVADLSNLHTSRGEFITGEIDEALDKPAIYGDVIENYKTLGGSGKAICYCASINHSKAMAKAFSDAGIRAAHIDGETPALERASAIQQFRSGELRVLCNVDLISEGFDVPDCSVAILLRPTQSLTLYIQQSMRCMRFMPDKRAVIIDHVQNYTRFGLPDDERHWDLNSKKKDNKAKKTFPVRTCPDCYYTMPTAMRTCPKCGKLLIEAREIEEVANVKLTKIEGFTTDYSSPDDCRTVAELRVMAARMGYKPGWAYYQAKRLGIIA